MPMRIALLCCVLGFACGPPPYARKAQQLLVVGDLDGAQAIVDRELPAAPKEPTLWAIKIRIALARHQTEQAISVYREWRTLRGADDDNGALRAMALSTLWNALSSPAPELRVQAIRVIEQQELHSLAREVSKHFNDDDILVRTTAAAAILRAHPDAPIIVTEALRSDNAEARRIAIEVLGRKTARSAADAIFRALSDPDASVRAEACRAAAKIKSSEAARQVEATLAKEKVPTVKTAAIVALTSMKATSARASVMAMLSDGYLGARLAALAYLDQVFGANDHATYVELAAGSDPFVALRAAVILVRHTDDSQSPRVLRSGLASKDWAVRVAALGALSQITKGQQALELSRPLLRDADEHVRLSAAHTVARLGDSKAATATLAVLLASKTADTRLHAALELNRLGDPRGRAALTVLADDASPDLRRRAFLGVQNRKHVDDLLLAGLGDSTGKNRIAAAERILRTTK